MTANEQYYEYLKGRSRLGLWYRRHWLYPRLSRHIRGRVLDVGCGIGDFLRYHSSAVGVDINPATVEWCRQQGLNAKMMSPDRLPFEDASFDSVVLDNVLEHLSNPTLLLGEIYRVLAPRGILVVGVPGQRGYDSDPDHKMNYNAEALIATVEADHFGLRHLFYTPFRSQWLNTRMRQYCVYGVFQRD